MSLNDTVRRRVSNTGEDITVPDLIVVEEAPVRLVHRAGDELSEAGGARSGAARVGKIHTCFLRHIQDVLVTRTADLLRPARSHQLHLVRGGGQADQAVQPAGAAVRRGGQLVDPRLLPPDERDRAPGAFRRRFH